MGIRIDIQQYTAILILLIPKNNTSTAKKHNFTNVIGIARGGLIPATIISYELDIPLLTIAVSSYNKKNFVRKNL